MGLADSLHYEFDAHKRKRCQLGAIIDGLEESERKVMESAVAQVREYRKGLAWANGHSQLTAAAIRRALVSEGYQISKDSVEKHVAESCMCKN